MRKIVFAVYHDCNREARSHEILECCKMMGEVHFVSYAEPSDIPDVHSYIIDKSKPLALFDFLNTAKKVIKQVKPDVVVLHDNDCAALIPFVKRGFPKAKLVYDSSELYIKEGTKAKSDIKNDGAAVFLKKKLTSFRRRYEKRCLKDADVVIAANIERAEIMKKYFGLKETPLVFDNIHRIDTEYDEAECEKKYGHAFAEDRFNVLFGGGISEERKTFDYISSFATLDRAKYRLVILGAASPVAQKNYNDMLEELGLDNVVYLGMIPRCDLRYCMKKSRASVVVFDEDSYNTKYCASGKCYESLFEGVPILASENPPLKRLCRENGVGCSNNDYAAAVLELEKNYEYHLGRVKDYIASLDYESRVGILYREILNRSGLSND